MSQQRNYGGYQSAGSEVTDFTRVSGTIAENVSKISQNVTSMQRMVNQLGTPQDSDSLRSQLHQLQHYTNQLAKDTNASLKELAHLTPTGSPSDLKQRRMLRDRLTSEFSEALRNFQVIQRTAAQKEKESVTRARAASKIGEDESPFGDVHSSSSFHSRQQQGQIQAQIQMEEEVDLDELRKREKSIRKIEGDIIDVNQIFKDLATMVHEQADLIDSIEAHVESATNQVVEGANQIQMARNHQTAARRKQMCLLLVLTVAVVAIALTIYFSAR